MKKKRVQRGKMTVKTDLQNGEIVRRDEVRREGVSAVYRLIRQKNGYAVSVECNGRSETPIRNC